MHGTAAERGVIIVDLFIWKKMSLHVKFGLLAGWHDECIGAGRDTPIVIAHRGASGYLPEHRCSRLRLPMYRVRILSNRILC